MIFNFPNRFCSDEWTIIIKKRNHDVLYVQKVIYHSNLRLNIEIVDGRFVIQEKLLHLIFKLNSFIRFVES